MMYRLRTLRVAGDIPSTNLLDVSLGRSVKITGVGEDSDTIDVETQDLQAGK